MMNNNDDIFSYGYFCDCCGSSEAELHTLEMDCPITLCVQCIKRFYALLDAKTPGIIIQLPRIHDEQ